MVTRPAMAAETITLFLGALFMVEGMMVLFAGLIYRFPSWGWTMANGLLTFLLGLMLAVSRWNWGTFHTSRKHPHIRRHRYNCSKMNSKKQ